MHQLKVIRISKNIFVYFNGNLAITSTFKEDNLNGDIGLFVYDSTGYFDNFHLRPIVMKNASDYINELDLNATNPTTRIGSIHTLRLNGISDGEALFSLSKSGKIIDSSIASDGSTVSLNFDNGKEGLNFRVTRLFDSENNSAVWPEDIILRKYDIHFSVTNQMGNSKQP